MKDCNNCKHKMCREYAEPCSSCTDMIGEPTNWTPQTNADRIRAMTDEELAKFAYSFPCPPQITPNQCRHDCDRCWLDWLKQEVYNDKQ